VNIGNLHKDNLKLNGFSVTKKLFSDLELDQLVAELGNQSSNYAIRQLVIKKPGLLNLIFNNENFKSLYKKFCGDDYFLTKAIFFNKPRKSNWFVNYHQDLSISTKRKQEEIGFSQWTLKDGLIGVIPPNEILENTFTFRIHLDVTDHTNGALQVIPKTHTKGIIRIDESFKKEEFEDAELCQVDKGGVMVMKPLLLHSSRKSTSDFDRRVIHLEFCNKEIPMEWLEKKIV
jgi:hypothetical protein